MLSLSDLKGFELLPAEGLEEKAGVFVVICDLARREMKGRVIAVEHSDKIRSAVEKGSIGRWISQCRGSLLYAVQYISDQSAREALAHDLRQRHSSI